MFDQATYQSAYYRRRYHTRKEAGLCPTCGGSPAPNRVRCQTCIEKDRHLPQSHISIRTRRWYYRVRVEAINHYGPDCACCGETHFEFLALDHINGGGNSERRKERSSRHLAKFLRGLGWPDGYQVLCHNCNQARGAYGYCPHQTPGRTPVLEDAGISVAISRTPGNYTVST